jgi:hypothetical protein
MSQSSLSALSPVRRLEQRLQQEKRKAPPGAMLQPSITNFFTGSVPEKKKLRIAEKVHDGIRSVRCEYCGIYFTPQGIHNHVALHMRKGSSKKLERANPSGRVMCVCVCVCAHLQTS